MIRRIVLNRSIFCSASALDGSTCSLGVPTGSTAGPVWTSQQPYSSASLPSKGVMMGHAGTLSSLQPCTLPFSMQPCTAGQVRGMFIQTQTTPNPQSIMFLPGRTVMESGSKEFSNARAGMQSPLANRLFKIDGVTGVFFGAEFITVTKQEDASWAVIKPDVFAAIMDHFSSGEPLILDEETLAKSDTAIHPEDDEVVAMIKELLETRIRPAVQEDGGDIVYKGFDEDTGVVTVKMMGACSGCPSSTVTLKSGIENMLMHYIPEVKGVIEADDEEEGQAKEEGSCSTSDKAAPPASPMEQFLSS